MLSETPLGTDGPDRYIPRMSRYLISFIHTDTVVIQPLHVFTYSPTSYLTPSPYLILPLSSVRRSITLAPPPPPLEIPPRLIHPLLLLLILVLFFFFGVLPGVVAPPRQDQDARVLLAALVRARAHLVELGAAGAAAAEEGLDLVATHGVCLFACFFSLLVCLFVWCFCDVVVMYVLTDLLYFDRKSNIRRLRGFLFSTGFVMAFYRKEKILRARR
ncbi:hypothetical protein F4778DRAFT_513511 [Xylariomycetidae sp. FL2044]|nr:hypothetical protein F4778DRAFT_513511 [Xylariomycetidae sp. FL2044]